MNTQKQGKRLGKCHQGYKYIASAKDHKVEISVISMSKYIGYASSRTRVQVSQFNSNEPNQNLIDVLRATVVCEVRKPEKAHS